MAIKVVRTDVLDPSQAPELLARLKREAQAAGRLSHPGIVAVYDYGEDTTRTGTPVAYIAMELVDGDDLKTPLDAGRRFTIADVGRLMGGILGALQHAHERGVTHRDIKPGNVMLRPDGSVKITDFGIAHLENSDLTRAGTVVGTPQYMAPEQLLGLRVDGRADLFACGVILYQLLTGARPFTGSYATVVQKVLNEDPPPPSTLNRVLAQAWHAVVRKAMAKKPEQRFECAAEFANAIELAASGSLNESTVALPAAAQAASAAAPPPSKPVAPVGRSKLAIATGAMLLVAAGVAVVALRPTCQYTRRHERGPIDLDRDELRCEFSRRIL